VRECHRPNRSAMSVLNPYHAVRVVFGAIGPFGERIKIIMSGPPPGRNESKGAQVSEDLGQ